ncbi:MAG: rhodanese-like domain-containing protein [Halieaceae bacterium]|jgi:rhodanese-related sulfurtransferase|nr:rhodanese-like domain-containing protein [Halieaceae bacterium]
MLRKASLIILIVCIVSGAAVVAQRYGLLGGSVPTVGVEALLASTADREGLISPVYQLVDVRSDEEIAVSLIPGAITRAQYERNPERYADKQIVPYCTVGARSRAYTESLRSAGVDAVNFDGSIMGWVEAGLPLQTLDGQPTVRVHTWGPMFDVPPGYVQVLD